MLPVSVEIKILHNEDENETRIGIYPIWSGVDRPNTGGWSIPNTPADLQLALRLKAAILAGKAAPFESIKTDVNGQTYVSCGHAVTGRRMKSDLRRLGF